MKRLVNANFPGRCALLRQVRRIGLISTERRRKREPLMFDLIENEPNFEQPPVPEKQPIQRTLFDDVPF